MKPRAGLDRAAVIRAAATLADAHGLEQLSLAALAEQLGVRTPTLYHYVDGLPGLRRELTLLAIGELETTVGHVLMGRSGDAAVLAMADAYRAYAKAHPGLYAATQRSALRGDDAELQAAQSQTTTVLLQALSAYNLAPEDALHTLRGLRAIVHGFAALEIAGGFGLPLDTDESFRRLLQTFLRGLRDS